MTRILIRREETQTGIEGRNPCEDGGRDWSDVVASQQTPKIDKN